MVDEIFNWKWLSTCITFLFVMHHSRCGILSLSAYNDLIILSVTPVYRTYYKHLTFKGRRCMIAIFG